jgi:ABC-2 type transport system ATP-binding protein
MEFVAERPVSVILSSHLIADLERVCDHLVVLAASEVQVTGDVDDLLASHHRLTGPRLDDPGESLPTGWELVRGSHTDRQSTLVVRSSAPVDNLGWHREPLGLEDLVLAYMTRAAEAETSGVRRRELETQR